MPGVLQCGAHLERSGGHGPHAGQPGVLGVVPVPRAPGEVEDGLVGAHDTVGDRLGHGVGLVLHHLGLVHEPEAVDAADRVPLEHPGRSYPRARGDCSFSTYRLLP